jgi:hypothetical protein
MCADERNPHEVAARAAVMGKIEAWWKAFEAKTGTLDDLFARRAQWDLVGWMREHLKGIDPHLMWEFGPAMRKPGHRVVITPEGRTYLRPMLDTILAKAPKLRNWEFYGYRPAQDPSRILQVVESRTGTEVKDARVTASLGNGRRIDLCYYLPGAREGDDKDGLRVAFAATETVLGEGILDQWIGRIDIRPASEVRGEDRFLPLERLKETVEALIASVVDQLPSEPLHAVDLNKMSASEKPSGTVFRLQPTRADDYPGFSDLATASCANKELWLGMHGSGAFYSARFSRLGEKFCYIKIDGADGLGASKYPDRVSVEDALDEALIPARAGRVVSGGTGLRYSYIDLALADVDRAIPLIRGCLTEGMVPRRTWVLFFDAPLAREWVGIYPETAAPPGLD